MGLQAVLALLDDGGGLDHDHGVELQALVCRGDDDRLAVRQPAGPGHASASSVGYRRADRPGDHADEAGVAAPKWPRPCGRQVVLARRSPPPVARAAARGRARSGDRRQQPYGYPWTSAGSR